MELDDLKLIWKEEAKQLQASQKVQIDEVRGILTRKSQTTIADIKATMKYKIGMTALTGLICATVAILNGFVIEAGDHILNGLIDKVPSVFVYSLLSVSLLVICLFNFVSYIRISDFEKSSLPIKETLEFVHRIIRSVMKLGTYSDLIVSPFIFGFVAYFAFYGKSGFELDIRLLYVGLIYLGGLALSYFGNRWQMQKRYGDDADRIEGYLEELE